MFPIGSTGLNETITFLTINNVYTEGAGISFIIIGLFLLFTLLALRHEDDIYGDYT